MTESEKGVGWQAIDPRPGEQGKAVCEALGLDPKKVAAGPIDYGRGKERVYLSYEAVAECTVEQLDAALAIVKDGLAPVDWCVRCRKIGPDHDGEHSVVMRRDEVPG